MWEHLGLKGEPPLMINPLITKDELRFFVNRETDLQELKIRIDGKNARNIIVSGDAGIGKTTLLCRIGTELDSFIRVDLSYLEEWQTILDRVTLEIAKYATKIGIKDGKQIEESIVYSTRFLVSTIKKGKVGIPILSGEYGKVDGSEKALRNSFISREVLIDTLLAKIQSRGSTPIIVLDEVDYLSEDRQEQNLRACKPLLSSTKCSCIFVTRKNISELFKSEVNSTLRGQFTDDFHVNPMISFDPEVVRNLLMKRLAVVAKRNFAYPFTAECEKVLGTIAYGNLRELFRYSLIVLQSACIERATVPIDKRFAMAALAKKRYFVYEIDFKEYLTLSHLKATAKSPSDKDIQEIVGLKRASLNNIMARLAEKGFLTLTQHGRKVLYSLSAKGAIIIEMFKKYRV